LPALSCTVCTTAVALFQPTITTFRSPAVCALGYVTFTEVGDDCGTVAAT